MRSATACLPQRPLLLGTCQDDRYIVDAVELVVSFDKVKSLIDREREQADMWWCWIVGWIMDIFEILAYADDKGFEVVPAMFHKNVEFGVSLSSLILKVTH